MDKDWARRLIADVVTCQKALDAAEITARECADEGERDRLRLVIAQAIGSLYAEIILQLIRVYPDLDPYPRDRP